MRKTVVAAASIIALSLGTTAAMAQHGGHMGGHIGGGHMGAPGGMHMGPAAGLGARAPGAIGTPGAMGARPNVAAAPNNFAVNRNAATPNTFAANPAYSGRGGNYAWHGRGNDHFRGRRFAFFPGFGGIYDYAGPTCYYDPNAPWTYNAYGYNNCYYDYDDSYNSGW